MFGRECAGLADYSLGCPKRVRLGARPNRGASFEQVGKDPLVRYRPRLPGHSLIDDAGRRHARRAARRLDPDNHRVNVLSAGKRFDVEARQRRYTRADEGTDPRARFIAREADAPQPPTGAFPLCADYQVAADRIREAAHSLCDRITPRGLFPLRLPSESLIAGFGEDPLNGIGLAPTTDRRGA